MGITFRKRKKVGPLQLNISQSGIGLSTGIKGARISVGPQGWTITFTFLGIQYRKRAKNFSALINEMERVIKNE